MQTFCVRNRQVLGKENPLEQKKKRVDESFLIGQRQRVQMAWVMQDDLRNVPGLKNSFQAPIKLDSEVADYVFSSHALFKEPSQKQIVNHYSSLSVG